MASSILLVEDDLYLSQGLTELLQKSGYVPCQAWNLSQARQSVYSRNFDLLILDVTLPDGDGISFCRELRASGCAAPILFLTARDEEFDIVTGLDAGGNDYVTKPFRVQELLSRIRVLLRKDSPNLTRGELEIDQARMQVLRQGVALPLTLTEYKILLCLIRQRGVATRDILLGAMGQRREIRGRQYALRPHQPPAGEDRRAAYPNRPGGGLPMGGLSIALSALCLGLLWGLLRQRQKTKKLYRQMEAFLDGQKAPLEISLGESPNARLQNAAARLENALVHAREQTRLEARRSENLLTDISHQLKTPLASLQLFVELDQGAHLEQEQAQLERMQALISGLLRLERLCADGYAFHFESHDLLELVGSCWQPLAKLYPEKTLTLTGTAALRCDEIWMGEAITNLLKNACEHTLPSGHIRISIEETAGEVAICLSDDGGGVSAEELPRLFERFYHGSHPGHGAGIGLAIVKEVVLRHHGSITAENIPGGLQFTLYFPKLDSCLAKS